MKKLTSLILTATLLLPLNIGISTENVYANDSTEIVINSEGFIEDWSKVKYISVDEYIEKYGGEKEVNEAFNRGEINNRVMLLRAEGKEAEANALLNQKNNTTEKTSDLILSLKEGKFLGLEIESISDLPPDNINVSVRVKGNNSITPSLIPNIETDKDVVSLNSTFDGTHSDGSSYRVLYSDNRPDEGAINNSIYEKESGSYFYKYGYSWTGDYQCVTEIEFDETTQLYSGTQNVNMYAFIGAVTDAVSNRAIDFGLMANPRDDLRNKGLYAVRNINRGEIDVDIYPKVNIIGSSTNPMKLENKKIKLKLVIDQYGEVGTSMYLGDSLIYYKSEFKEGFASGNDKVLTFFQAMSCVKADDKDPDTKPDSGSYFKNVRFSNTKLSSFSNGENNFGTFGDNTYYVYICKPEKINYSYGSNSETVSIEYN